eukprot:6724824-Ditylum_brightwellii.AAC.1
MAALHHACLALNNKEQQDFYYFIKPLSILSNTKVGVIHAGSLLSQHLLIIGSAVVICPVLFCHPPAEEALETQ